MKELLEIFKCKELSKETRKRIMKKMVPILDYQVAANIYGEIVDELISALDEN